MKLNDVLTKGDRNKLTFDQRKLLEEQILPTAHRWLQTYHPSSAMYGAAQQTIAYWSEK